MDRQLVPIQSVPCLTETATLLFEALVKDKTVFEFGAGGSTLWLAQLASRLVSVEDDAGWHEAVLLEAEKLGLEIDVRLVPTKDLPGAIEDEWDIVFVDCMTQDERRRAILRGAQHVKPGGWLIADDYDFPLTQQSVEKLRDEGWDVGVLAGVKIHPLRGVPVTTSTAFCHKLEDASEN